MRRELTACALLLALALRAPAADPPKTAPEAEAKARVEALRTALKGTDAAAKAGAIDACGKSPHPMTAGALAPLLGDASDDIRGAAAAALGRMVSLPDAAKALHSGLAANAKKAPVEKAIFSALESVGDASSVAVVSEWVLDYRSKKDEDVVSMVDSAIACLGGLKFKASVRALMEIQKKIEVSSGPGKRGSASPPRDKRPSDALGRLTGQKFTKAAEWEEWWKKTEATLKDDLTPKTK